MNLLVLYIVLTTNLFWLAWIKLGDIERPYRQRYAHLSDMQLIFGAEDSYEKMMRWLDQGGQGLEELEKCLFLQASYIDELRHRRVGDIDWKAEKERASDYVARHQGFTP